VFRHVIAMESEPVVKLDNLHSVFVLLMNWQAIAIVLIKYTEFHRFSSKVRNERSSGLARRRFAEYLKDVPFRVLVGGNDAMRAHVTLHEQLTTRGHDFLPDLVLSLACDLEDGDGPNGSLRGFVCRTQGKRAALQAELSPLVLVAELDGHSQRRYIEFFQSAHILCDEINALYVNFCHDGTPENCVSGIDVMS
jgi:hypothetical protein